MMNRLTRRIRSGKADCAYCESYGNCGGNCELFQKQLEKLATYEETSLTPAEVVWFVQAKADGRLIELPCKVGDTIYDCGEYFEPSKKRKNPQMIIEEIENINIEIYINGCELPSFGNTIFLTKTEAQAAIIKKEEVI